MTQNQLQQEYQTIEYEATRLAGGLMDLSQRATVYHHIYAHSGGNHAFPLIAAHGALWARGYFRFGFMLGQWLSLPHAIRRGRRAALLHALGRFADAFRDVNRRVCADTYAYYHFTARFGEQPDATTLIPPDLLEGLNRVHAARRAGRSMALAEKRDVFQAFLVNEQHTIVGPSIQKAVAAFPWPLLKHIALRPLIRFAYFPDRSVVWFRNFADVDERIRNGLRAFDLADRAGWPNVEAALRHYQVLPDDFFAGPNEYFATLRRSLLAVPRAAAF